MTEPNLHVRVSLLNPEATLTPLKFRGWLREQASDIDRKSRESCMTNQVSVIRLFLTERLRLQIGQTKLDRILQDIVDKFSTIHRIELRNVDGPLSFEEMMAEQAQAQEELESLYDLNGHRGSDVHQPTKLH